MRQTGRLHSLAKTICRSASAGAAKEQSSHDHSEDRKRDGLWNCWLQRKKRRHLSRFSKVIEIVRGQACGRNRLDANQPVALGLDNFNPSSLKARFSLVGKAPCAVRSAAAFLTALSRRPRQRALAKKMHMQVGNTFARIWPTVDDDAIAAG